MEHEGDRPRELVTTTEGGDAVACSLNMRLQLDHAFFDRIESMIIHVEKRVIDLHIEQTIKSLVPPISIAIIVPGLIERLVQVFKGFHHHPTKIAAKSYSAWVPDESDIAQVRDTHIIPLIPWDRATHLLEIFTLYEDMHVTVRVCLNEWTIELYDALLHIYRDSELERRQNELKPLCRLLPRLLDTGGYWGRRTKSKSKKGEMKVVLMPPESQYMAIDRDSSGIYAMMYMDQLVFDNKIEDYVQCTVDDYRLGCFH